MVDYSEQEAYADYEESKSKSSFNKIKYLDKKYIIWFAVLVIIGTVWYASINKKDVWNYFMIEAIVFFILLLLSSQQQGRIITRKQAESILEKEIREDLRKDHGDLIKGYHWISKKGRLVGEAKPLRLRWRICFVVKNYFTGALSYYFGYIHAYSDGPGFDGWEERPEGIRGDEMRENTGYFRAGYAES